MTEENQSDIDSIRKEADTIIEKYRVEVETFKTKLDAELQPLNKQLEVVWQAMQEKTDDLEAYVLDRLEPDVDLPDEDDVLFDSEREYGDQLIHYKKHQGKSS